MYPTFIIIIIFLTPALLCSFGLMHLTKNGWHCPRVFMSESRDFLNCVPRVGDFLRVSPLCLMSWKNRRLRYLFPAVSMSLMKSGLKVSRFLSRKPEKEEINLNQLCHTHIESLTLQEKLDMNCTHLNGRVYLWRLHLIFLNF